MTRMLLPVVLLALLGGCDRHDRNEREESIKGEREALRRAAAAQAEARKAHAEAAARKEGAEAQLRSAVTFRLTDKGFQPKDVPAGRYEDLFLVRAEYENTSGKDLRSFAGTINLRDENGNIVLSGKVHPAEPLPAGGKGTWKAQKPYDQFSPDDEKLKTSNMARVRVEWVPRSIVFADGTALGRAP